jgi:hypothetical protein
VHFLHKVEGPMSQRRARETVAPLVVKPKDARIMLSCSQERLYQLLNAGELQSFKDGRARKITVESIKAYIKRGVENDKAKRN